MRAISLLISIAIFLLSTSVISGQLSRSFSVFAETLGDPYDGDGISEDNCSAVKFLVESMTGFDIELSSVSCNQNGIEGEPQSIFTHSTTINHSNATTVKSYIGHSIPIGFSLSVNTDYLGFPDNLANHQISVDFGHSFKIFNTINSQSLEDGLASLPISSGDHLMLTSDEFQFNFEYDLKGSNDPNGYVFVGAESTPIKLLLPSQFYSDNLLTPPSSVSIPTSAGSVSFQVEAICAENIYLEDGIDLDSYQYSSSALLASSSAVRTNANVTFSGGDCVLLEAGFTVELGAEMETVDYTGCTN